MVGRLHREHSQRGGGGADNSYHTMDELHRIPPGLCEDVVNQVEERLASRVSQPEAGLREPEGLSQNG